MEAEIVDPLDVSKHPKIIKEAQRELGKLDILVCGRCHGVFHYIEQFQEHRQADNCTGLSSIRENNINESKAQVWAFLLWKGAHQLDENENSWLVYQRWCKMEAQAKEAWIVAGRNVQVFTKLSAAKMQEVRAKVQTKTREEDPLEEGEIRRTAKQYKGKSFDSELEDPLADSDDPLDSDSELDTEEEAEREEMEKMETMKNSKAPNDIANKDKESATESEDSAKPTQPLRKQLNSAVTLVPIPKKPQGVQMPLDKSARIAKRTDKATSTVKDWVVEKILAKRFNPRKKLHEYLLKWDGCPHDQNTWEPAAHMEACRHLLEAFERDLARQKEAKAAAQLAQQRQQARPKPGVSPGPSGVVATTPGGRPQRTSKQKALDQVKAWCGNISDRDEDLKRKAGSDSDSGPEGKRPRASDQDAEDLGSDSEDEWRADEEDERPQLVTLKPKVVPKVTGAVNGVGRKAMTANEVAKSIGLASPERPNSPPMMVTNTKGVVKVYPRQMSTLSSGVYIMSKKEGIVKLDSAAAAAAVPGNASIVRVQKSVGAGAAGNVVRVAPKIGQTQVRVVQKGDAVVRLSPGMSQTSTPKPKTVIRSAVRPQGVKLTPQILAQRSAGNRGRGGARAALVTTPRTTPVVFDETAEEHDRESEDTEDDYDPFPKDLPPLGPDSPQRDFTLDPETGMIVGKAEGEPSPQPEPSPPAVAPSLPSLKEECTTPEPQEGAENPPVPVEIIKNEDATDEVSQLIIPDSVLPDAVDASSALGEGAQISIPDGGEPLMITGEDGVVYQVAGQNEEGQTLLVAQTADGQQQCVYVTTADTSPEQSTEADGTVLTLDGAVAEAMGEGQLAVQTAMETEAAEGDGEAAGEGADNQVVAQLIKAEPASPGGTRKVVLLLPDGNLLMTEVDAEQFEALELDK